jgi:hypothetical protein
MYRCLLSCVLVVAACGSPERHDPLTACIGPDCVGGACKTGEVRDCYLGDASTIGVGQCTMGAQTCIGDQWGTCQGVVTPSDEVCGDTIDNNCNGQVDEDADADGDGYTRCGGDCCDSLSQCSNPAGVNPGAYDVIGDSTDNDCDGNVDNTPASCDDNLTFDTLDPRDYAKAIDLCQVATEDGDEWGLIDAQLTRADGNNEPNPLAHVILGHYGQGITPHAGSKLALFSTGKAGGEGDPYYDGLFGANLDTISPYPADFMAANNDVLPNAPGCPAASGAFANDPIMLTLRVRVPTNASSFSLDINFLSAEFPEYTCTAFNDFFVVLLDSQYAGTPANPPDKNLAIYTVPSTNMTYPVGVNLAANDTGLFTQCMNGRYGCDFSDSPGGTISTCTGIDQLVGTGLDGPQFNECDANSLVGGGTGWLTTTGNVVPGEVMTLRIALWDTSDANVDSMVVLDDFRWHADPSTPGTVIGRNVSLMSPAATVAR